MSESQLLQAWHDNAELWTHAVRERLIPSRLAVTDEAILGACGEGFGKELLDLGCGEGWLSQRLSAQGWRVLGTDGVPELIALARAAGEGEFLVVTYEVLEAALGERRFDTVVANFSLLGDDSVRQAVSVAYRVLLPRGRLLIQTLHPRVIEPYVDGWGTEDWSTFAGEGWVATPWYFRTLESWCSLLLESGFRLSRLLEPRASGSPTPSSLLLIAEREH